MVNGLVLISGLLRHLGFQNFLRCFANAVDNFAPGPFEHELWVRLLCLLGGLTRHWIHKVAIVILIASGRRLFYVSVSHLIKQIRSYDVHEAPGVVNLHNVIRIWKQMHLALAPEVVLVGTNDVTGTPIVHPVTVTKYE